MSGVQDLLPNEMKSAAKTFALGTNVPCFYIDSKGSVVLQHSAEQAEDTLCSHCFYRMIGGCHQVYLYGKYQSERFGGKYIFFCPLGLAYCVSPVVTDIYDITAFFAGPLQMMDSENFMFEEFLRKSNMNFSFSEPSSDSVIEMKQQIDRMPVIAPERVSAISELVFLIADSISKNGLGQFKNQRDSLEKNAAVSVSIHALKNKDLAGEDTQYPLDKERDLLTKISLGDKAGAQELLNDILGYVFFSTGRDFDIIRARAQELVVMLSRGALEGGADINEIFGLNRHYLIDINNLSNLEELTVWLSKILTRFTDCVFNLSDIRHKDVIFQTINYIRLHFTSHISLDDVAKYVHLNASYLSRVFKEEMQTNFVTYVNSIRIEASKKLLLDSSIPLMEVSDRVGFDEQSYFTKVFKKMTGVTPGKYRESRGVIPPVSKKAPLHPNHSVT